jgi:hypothetical protein
MLKITRIETVYPAPADDEEDYCPDGESDSRDEEVSFRELIDLMREHCHPSSMPLRGDAFEWFSTEAYQCPYSGEYTEQSLHFSRENPPRMLKYWRAAMRAAGHRVA